MYFYQKIPFLTMVMVTNQAMVIFLDEFRVVMTKF